MQFTLGMMLIIVAIGYLVINHPWLLTAVVAYKVGCFLAEDAEAKGDDECS